jgi:hypothetical protein
MTLIGVKVPQHLDTSRELQKSCLFNMYSVLTKVPAVLNFVEDTILTTEII